MRIHAISCLFLSLMCLDLWGQHVVLKSESVQLTLRQTSLVRIGTVTSSTITATLNTADIMKRMGLGGGTLVCYANGLNDRADWIFAYVYGTHTPLPSGTVTTTRTSVPEYVWDGSKWTVVTGSSATTTPQTPVYPNPVPATASTTWLNNRIRLEFLNSVDFPRGRPQRLLSAPNSDVSMGTFSSRKFVFATLSNDANRNTTMSTTMHSGNFAGTFPGTFSGTISAVDLSYDVKQLNGHPDLAYFPTGVTLTLSGSSSLNAFTPVSAATLEISVSSFQHDPKQPPPPGVSWLLPPPPQNLVAPDWCTILVQAGITATIGEPARSVQFPGPFKIGKYEVTWNEWKTVKAWAEARGYRFDRPGAARGENHPVRSITWYDAVRWCNAKSEMDGKDPVYYTDNTHADPFRLGQPNFKNDFVKPGATGYRLPTEAEWEFAVRYQPIPGTLHSDRFPWGNVINVNLARYWYSRLFSYDSGPARSNARTSTVEVDSFPQGASASGMYNAAGNVWEWCWDRYSPNPDSTTPFQGPDDDQYDKRVARGGGWLSTAENCRVAKRGSAYPGASGGDFGFRIVSLP
jgi:formylglycine-generating enzyme required for sulfatase activity